MERSIVKIIWIEREELANGTTPNKSLTCFITLSAGFNFKPSWKAWACIDSLTVYTTLLHNVLGASQVVH